MPAAKAAGKSLERDFSSSLYQLVTLDRLSSTYIPCHLVVVRIAAAGPSRIWLTSCPGRGTCNSAIAQVHLNLDLLVTQLHGQGDIPVDGCHCLYCGRRSLCPLKCTVRSLPVRSSTYRRRASLWIRPIPGVAVCLSVSLSLCLLCSKLHKPELE